MDTDLHAVPVDGAAPLRVPVWAWLVVVLALSVAYLLTLENGAILRTGATQIHELFHDGRHFFGVPCH